MWYDHLAVQFLRHGNFALVIIGAQRDNMGDLLC